MSARGLLVAGNVGLAAALLATRPTALGARWHHDAAYAALALATLAAIPLLRRRKLTTLLLASAGVWSMLTGIALIHVTPATGGARWMAFWHGATSVAFGLAFLAHWARNHPRLRQLAAHLAARRAALATVAGAWGALALFGAASVATSARILFDDALSPHLTNGALALAAAGFVWGSILLAPRMRDAGFRRRARGAVDASLLAAAWLALASGFPLLYLGGALRRLDAYWLVTGWHVILSAALLGLIAAHVAFNARPLAAHARGRG